MVLGLGATFFVIGEIGNLVYHIYLAALRLRISKQMMPQQYKRVTESPIRGCFRKLYAHITFSSSLVARNCSDGAGNSRLLGVSKHD